MATKTRSGRTIQKPQLYSEEKFLAGSGFSVVTLMTGVMMMGNFEFNTRRLR